jgi:hypothetical protein
MRKRLRKKRHRDHLLEVCGYVVTFDDGLLDQLLRPEPGTPFRVDGDCSAGIKRLIQAYGLRFWVAVARKLGPATAVVVFWAEEFPAVKDEALIFSAADLGLTDLLARKRQERRLAEQGAPAYRPRE